MPASRVVGVTAGVVTAISGVGGPAIVPKTSLLSWLLPTPLVGVLPVVLLPVLLVKVAADEITVGKALGIPWLLPLVLVARQ